VAGRRAAAGVTGRPFRPRRIVPMLSIPEAGDWSSSNSVYADRGRGRLASPIAICLCANPISASLRSANAACRLAAVCPQRVWKCCGVSRRSSDDETQQVLVRVTYSATAALAWPGALAQVGLCRARAHRTASSTMCWATSANLRSSAWLIARSWANASSAVRPVRPRMRPIA
jgi:hypothetical protein